MIRIQADDLKQYSDVLRSRRGEAITVRFVEPRDAEELPVADALGRVTAAAVFARVSVPHYHAAAMDGIAVRAERRLAPLAITHQGLFPAATISFNLAPGASLSEALADLHAAERDIGLPETVTASLSGAAAESESGRRRVRSAAGARR